MEMSPAKRITLDTYNRESEGWSKSHGNLDYWASEFELFDYYRRSLNLPNGPILDVGCGFGRDWHLFSNAGYEYLGIDLSEEQIRRAKTLFPDGEFLVADMEALPFGNNSFNGSWAVASYLHIEKEKIKSALLHLNSKLVKSSVSLFVVKEGEGEGIFEEDPNRPSSLKGPRYFAYYERKEFKQILEECGFGVINYQMRYERRKSGESLVWLEYYTIKS